MRHSLSFPALFLFALLLSPMPLLRAEEPAQQAIEQFLELIKSMEFPVQDVARQTALADKASGYLDLEAMSRKALVAHWDKATDEEKVSFLDLMGKLVKNVAYPKSSRFMGDYDISYPEVKPVGGGFEVLSKIKQEEQGLDVSILYHVLQKEGAWKIDDVVLDGVSITEDLQYQFDKLIQQGQFPGLLETMKKRLAEAEKQNLPAVA